MRKPIKNTLIPLSSLLSTLFLAALTLFFLSSCATLKKDDCVTGNWSGIGFNDAAAGLKNGVQFRAHTKACAKYKIIPDTTEYKAGYTKGLPQFCTSHNGYTLGLNKKQYNAVCPQSLQKRFLNGYLAGLETANAELTEEIADLRYNRSSAILKYLRIKQDKKTNNKNIKKWADRIDSLETSIDSRRSSRRELRRWHNYWAAKLK